KPTAVPRLGSRQPALPSVSDGLAHRAAAVIRPQPPAASSPLTPSPPGLYFLRVSLESVRTKTSLRRARASGFSALLAGPGILIGTMQAEPKGQGNLKAKVIIGELRQDA